MTIRNLMLGGAVCAVLIGGLIAASPLLAASMPSTPEEQAQTDDLNRHGVREIRPTPEEQAAYDAAQSDYQARLRAYNDQKKAYEERRGAYRNEVDRYRNQTNAYQNDRDTYQDQSDSFRDDPAHYDEDTQAPPPQSFDNDTLTYPEMVAHLERLETFADDGHDIADAPVEDRHGNIVGHFRHMQPGRDGEPTAIITLHDENTVQVPADNLRYNPDRDTVLADLTYNELERMRGV